MLDLSPPIFRAWLAITDVGVTHALNISSGFFSSATVVGNGGV